MVWYYHLFKNFPQFVVTHRVKGDEIPAELLKIVKKMMLLMGYTQYVCKFRKLSSGHRTGKGQFSFQSQRKEMQKMLKLPHNCTHLKC